MDKEDVWDIPIGSSNTITSVGAVDLVSGHLASELQHLQRNYVRSFLGLEVRVDPELKGNGHYISVSQEMYDSLQEIKDAYDED